MDDTGRTAREGFEDLYRRHYGELLRYVARQVDPETARDVVAETMLIAWRRWDEVPPNARAWLYAVARNTVLNANRSTVRRERLMSRVAADQHADLPDVALAVVNAAFARALLERLESTDREALELIEWDQLTPAEAAHVTGTSRTAFRLRLHRARRRLQQLVLEQSVDDQAVGEQTASQPPRPTAPITRLGAQQ